VKHWPDLQVLPRCVEAQLTSVPAGSHVERRDLATIQCLGPFGIVSRSQRSATSKAAYWWPAENPALRRRGHSPDTQDQGKTQSMSPFVRWNRRARKWDGSPSSGVGWSPWRDQSPTYLCRSQVQPEGFDKEPPYASARIWTPSREVLTQRKQQCYRDLEPFGYANVLQSSSSTKTTTSRRRLNKSERVDLHSRVLCRLMPVGRLTEFSPGAASCPDGTIL
jgi:hypothetical protein